jgi:protein-L-isoaspartate O-methyltransferase
MACGGFIKRGRHLRAFAFMPRALFLLHTVVVRRRFYDDAPDEIQPYTTIVVKFRHKSGKVR